DGSLAVRIAGPRAGEPAALERFLRQEARRAAQAFCATHAAALGVQVTRIRIADQRSRWGSATSQGGVGFDWRLLRAPCDGFESLVVHELCHLVEMNHSKRFWAVVASRRPDYRAWQDWLSRHGVELRLWSANTALGN